MKPLLLIGCGGHARSLIELIESSPDWHIYGLVGLPGQVGRRVLGYPVIGCDDDLLSLREDCQTAIMALGQLQDSAPRVNLTQKLENAGFQFPVLCSPHAVISRHAHIGAGTTIGHGVVVNASASIGNHCIINSLSLIEHDVQIGNHCHISTGVLVNGGVTLGSCCFVGSGAMIREGLKIPSCTVISAGKRVMGWPLKESLVK